ncbi:hypothetical protein H8N01_19800 [Streptomyces sp. AC536]|uniref:hypothetical protein n=1 Tax=Streptomyces buecherae TaxID=2763006 RepID=UPI00164E862A|nr:hypothetical protein [Streptomyces buecherae]MBC3984751.1 hypothetical protein [Streptomyces buecherae]QNJ42274.1 hypothetical protein H7H31_22870 [Streptomyces buecherae]
MRIRQILATTATAAALVAGAGAMSTASADIITGDSERTKVVTKIDDVNHTTKVNAPTVFDDINTKVHNQTHNNTQNNVKHNKFLAHLDRD